MTTLATRRTRIGWTYVLVLALLGAAACGGADDSADDAVPTSTSTETSAAAGTTGGLEPSSSAPSSDAFPVVIQHVFGTVTIDEFPDRVVSIGFKDQDWLYQFGVSPILVRDWQQTYPGAVNPWAADLLVGDTPETFTGELPLERIAALDPDLIVGVYVGQFDQETYDLLTEIAPVLAQPPGTEGFGTPWQDATAHIGAALGQAELAQRIVDETEAALNASLENHPELAGARAIVAAADIVDELPMVGVRGSADPRVQLVEQMGLVTPPEVEALAGELGWAELSNELVGETFDLADVVLIQGAPAPLASNPTFGASRVASEGRVVYLDSPAIQAAFAFASPLSIRFLAETLGPQLAAALDGDASTTGPAWPDT